MEDEQRGTTVPGDVRAVDASMALLRSIQQETVDPDYAQFTAQGRKASWRWGILSLALGLVFGVMAATYGLSAGARGSATAYERNGLLAQIQDAEQRNQELADQEAALKAEITRLEAEQLGYLPHDEAESVWTADIAVTGPGVVITIEENPAFPEGLVVDQDLRQVVNGLWISGAEAVAINGHRLSARTAIRQAGGAVTVNYRSVSGPYVIEAIGDPAGLLRGFASSDGGLWLSFLQENYQITWTMNQADELHLNPDAGVDVSYAAPDRGGR